ncbi:ATP-binding protein [Nitriliruptor alkaliphilus]|uniref:ATP-binding protein n=1 Tax=Nitriliruptor alkaliphilus TaxID=427918 RepID=UPI00069630AF|nr:AAA family ATPase [Nitriliruptor alkaliphilus]
MSDELLERAAQLELLRGATRDAIGGRGAVVLVAGEAGIGKSSLVRAWTADLGGEVAVLVGGCDDLLTSRTLGPFHDIARRVPGPLAAAVAEADTGGVCDALLTLFDNPLRATILVLEDVHWADEATLDVVRYVGRRLERLPALLVLTYREDDVGVDHPLTGVIGVLPSGSVRRVRLHPLSRGAVATLTADTRLDPAEVLANTGGNPFFVTEVLLGGTDGSDSGGTGVPDSVAGAVLARVRTLPEATREALGLLAVVPRPTPLSELRGLLGDPTVVAPAERRGLLTVQDAAIGFRHELARQAVLGSLPATTRVRHHGTVLDHLLETPHDRLAILHHALEAGRSDLIVAHGPAIANEAFRAGAQRQAVGHQRQVLRYAAALPPTEHAQLLEEHAWSLYNLHDFASAAVAADEAVTVRRQLGDEDDLVAALLVLARMRYMLNHPLDAARTLDEAEALLASCTREETTAEVAVQRMSLDHLTDRHDAVLDRARHDRELLERVGRPDLLVHAGQYVGASKVLRGDVQGGVGAMRAALRRGLDVGLLEPVARAYTNLVELLLTVRRFDEMDEVAEQAISFYDDHDFRAHRFNTVGQRARLALYRGRWDEAEEALRSQVAAVGHAGVLGAIALESLALLAVRRGREDAEQLLERAWGIAVDSGSAQYIVPVACAGIEQAWLEEDHDAARRFIDVSLAAAGDTLLSAWVRWRLPLVGEQADPTGAILDPERRSLSGDTEGAVLEWRRLGMPYEEALELARSRRPEDLLDALAILDRLGAGRAARIVRRQLRDLGLTHIPRGPRAATLSNPAGLTSRQLEVLHLVADGLTNPEIAERLVLSNRTVDHHVSAVLQKLGTSSRHEAAELGRELGMLG